MTTKKHEEEPHTTKRQEEEAKRQREADQIDKDLQRQAEHKPGQPTDDPLASPTYDVHGPNPPSTPEKK